jgi:hypothetical protein
MARRQRLGQCAPTGRRRLTKSDAFDPVGASTDRSNRRRRLLAAFRKRAGLARESAKVCVDVPAFASPTTPPQTCRRCRRSFPNNSLRSCVMGRAAMSSSWPVPATRPSRQAIRPRRRVRSRFRGSRAQAPQLIEEGRAREKQPEKTALPLSPPSSSRVRRRLPRVPRPCGRSDRAAASYPGERNSETATASAGRAARVRRKSSRASRAPLQRNRLAVWGRGRGRGRE